MSTMLMQIIILINTSCSVYGGNTNVHKENVFKCRKELIDTFTDLSESNKRIVRYYTLHE